MITISQPPSGGCVLKLSLPYPISTNRYPAAFRRLCVETIPFPLFSYLGSPAAFRRLCVETCKGRAKDTISMSSRLQAAVC